MIRVLVIDDEENLRKLLSRTIELEGYEVIQAPTIKDGLRLLGKGNIHVVISDIRLPDGNGIELIPKIKQLYPLVEMIMLTAHGNIPDGVKAIQQGALDYLTKEEYQSRILPLLNQAATKIALKRKVTQLEKKLVEQFGFEKILGKGMAITQCIALARKVAPTDTTVFLTGETGTGKEIFAQAIHFESARKDKPFVAVNCSAFAKDLLESELFGHVQGAYTGATSSQKGLMEEADGGTLFLDELGEMSIDLQAKLLRVLETGDYYKVGESKPRHVDVRVIAATNRNLVQEYECGNFRQDLYYRISVFTITLPPLRERKEDVKLFADFFIKHFSEKVKKTLPRLSSDFLASLQHHSWKGNIRELKNVIERCIIINDGEELTSSLLPFDFNLPTAGDLSNENYFSLSVIEKSHIQKVLHYTGDNKTKTAKLLDIGLTTLYKKIKDYEL